MKHYHGWLYGTSAALWVSGVGWLVSHYLTGTRDSFGYISHPYDEWWLRAHGAALIAFLIALGALIPAHMVPWWRRRRNRVSAGLMLLVVGLLILTGYGLYYSADETLKPWISTVHWIVGLGAAAALIGHRAFGKLRKAVQVRERGADTVSAMRETG